MRRYRFSLACILLLILLPVLAACDVFAIPTPVEPLSEEYIPTAIALTFEAGHAADLTRTAQAQTPVAQVISSDQAGPTPGSNTSVNAGTAMVSKTEARATHTPRPPVASETQTPTASLVPNPTSSPQPTRTPTPGPSPTASHTPSPTPLPDIPIADIQIFRPGGSSRVSSPLRISAYLRPGAGGNVRIELFGEDGRLLVRQIKDFQTNPSVRVNLYLDLEFQIAAVAEVGRLVISVEDEFGRPLAINSADLILLSIGESDVNPADGLLQAILIEQPGAKNLVQGGTLVVRGLAQPNPENRLVAQLISERGSVVGSRLVALGEPLASGYAPFAVEVPYDVPALTPVRLVVYEAGGDISPYAHLSSLELFVSP